MNSKSIVGLAIVAAFGLGSVSSYISYANYGNRTERALMAKVDDNQNIYANGTQKVVEMAQVPTIYKNDLKEIVSASIQGRYGPNGSQAVFQMLKEHNQTLDPELYKKIQQAIEGFRNEFQQGQKEMLDMRRSYETSLGNVWSGMWLSFAGYPKVSMKSFDIVTTDKAAETFKTKRDSGIQLNQSK